MRRAERDRADLVRLLERVSFLEARRTELQAANNRLTERARVAERARTENIADSARLDWLDHVNARTNDRNKTHYGWRFEINHNRAALSDCHFPPRSVRTAIDEARTLRQEAERAHG